MRMLRTGHGRYAVYQHGTPVGDVHESGIRGMWLAEGMDGRQGIFPDKRTAAEWLAGKEPIWDAGHSDS